MILYICEKDGTWTIGSGLAEAMATALGQVIWQPCPKCALPMYRVQPADLVRVERPALIEAIALDAELVGEGGQPT